MPKGVTRCSDHAKASRHELALARYPVDRHLGSLWYRLR
jgi:hypothetical protein